MIADKALSSFRAAATRLLSVSVAIVFTRSISRNFILVLVMLIPLRREDGPPQAVLSPYADAVAGLDDGGAATEPTGRPRFGAANCSGTLNGASADCADIPNSDKHIPKNF